MKSIVSRKRIPMSIDVPKLRCRGTRGIHVGQTGGKDHSHLPDEGSRGRKVIVAAVLLLPLPMLEVHQ
jgi:hypothetical protein